MPPLPTPAGADPARQATVELEVIWVGDTRAPQAWIFRPPAEGPLARLNAAGALVRPGGPSLPLPLLSFVVRHPTQGTILVDTGLHPDATQSLRRDYGLANGVLFRSLRPAPHDFAAQLRSLGIEPAQVQRVVMTHLHVDHTSGMRLLPAAEFVCTQAEWAAARAPRAALNGYAPQHLPPASRMRLVDFDEGAAHGPFSRTIDLLGDGSVRLVSTPGHTRGHMSVLLRLAERPVLVVGDAVYTLRSLEEEILSFRTVDDELYRRSLREVKAYAQAEPSAALIPTHDQDAWRAYASAPTPA